METYSNSTFGAYITSARIIIVNEHTLRLPKTEQTRAPHADANARLLEIDWVLVKILSEKSA